MLIYKWPRAAQWMLQLLYPVINAHDNIYTHDIFTKLLKIPTAILRRISICLICLFIYLFICLIRCLQSTKRIVHRLIYIDYLKDNKRKMLNFNRQTLNF